MSAEAVGWVWKYSPMEKSGLLVHLAIADVTNDLHGNKLWCSTDTLRLKTRLSRRAVVYALDALVAQDLLVENVRPGRTTLYQFRMPDLPMQNLHYHDEGPVQDSHTGVQEGDTTRAESAPELKRTQPDNFSSRAKKENCDQWADVPNPKGGWTVAPCVLPAGHSGECEPVRPLELVRERKDVTG